MILMYLRENPIQPQLIDYHVLSFFKEKRESAKDFIDLVV